MKNKNTKKILHALQTLPNAQNVNNLHNLLFFWQKS